MHIDYSNVNTLWASILVETLVRLGLKTVVISPGSRSTPLTVAFAQQRKITKIPVLDERSAAFLALGIAKRTHQPTVLVCTSGTAGANFYPAVIEAQQTHVPLIIMTADRPPELRNCRAGQTIDQVKLYGNYPNWQTELATPSPEIAMLSYLRQTIIQAWERALLPLPGVVHINLPFREPLAPIREIGIETVKANLDLNKFFAHIRSVDEYSIRNNFIAPSVLEIWQKSRQGLIIAGLAQPQARYSYCQAIAHLSEIFAFPVIAEALSPLRNYSEVNPRVITSYDLILSNEELAQELVPEIIIQIGELPTSKTLRTWLANLSCPRYILDNNYENLDPLHGNSISLNCSWESLKQINLESNNFDNIKNNEYQQKWLKLNKLATKKINNLFINNQAIIEAKVAWLLAEILPQNSNLFVANSMPVRYMEYFWQINNSQVNIYFNRGANGIDGTLSTALGMAHEAQNSNFLLTGDLALLHDTNGFLIREKFFGNLTIILINNNGGGIFQLLPIAQCEVPFEDFFATPQNINFAQLCSTYQIEYQKINSWLQLKHTIQEIPPTDSYIRLLEITTNRQLDAIWLKESLEKLARELSTD